MMLRKFFPSFLAFALGASSFAQAPTFAGNAQHTSIFTPAAQPMNKIKWQTTIDTQNSSGGAHYGTPLITAANTIIVPVKTSGAGNGTTLTFRIDAFTSAGILKYTLTPDFALPHDTNGFATYGWVPVYQPVVANGPSGPRLYYAGAGGTIWRVDNIDTNTPSAPVRVVFYGAANYNAGSMAGFNASVFINTPITADSQGNVYFGFRTYGTPPSTIPANQGGYARISSTDVATYVLATNAASDANVSRDTHNSAPALSNDEATLYVAVKGTSGTTSPYLLGLNSTTLATKYKVALTDPRNANSATVTDDSTASPMVAPDGDVYLGVLSNPYNGSRGWLLRFNGDLTLTKTPGAFGWDNTPAIVPSSMVPSYTGTSTYLLFCKYNNYAINDGNGVNRVAVIDPNATQLDPHPSASGQLEMREVMSQAGPSPDSGYFGASYPFAVREWCINTPAVNPATNSVLFDSEDGRLYRWDLSTNTMTEGIVLTPGIGEPYVPTTMGPDGTIYTLNGGTLFAIGADPLVNITIRSSMPDSTNVPTGASITFTAHVAMAGGSPTGTVVFTKTSFSNVTPTTTTLGSASVNAGTGDASFTTALLTAGTSGGNSNLGSHFITATFTPGAPGIPAPRIRFGVQSKPQLGSPGPRTSSSTYSVTMVQKVHAYSTTTTVTSNASIAHLGSAVTFTATVTSAPAATGQVTFYDGATVIGQTPIVSGAATFSTSALTGGSHMISATYMSDTDHAASSGTMSQTVARPVSGAVTLSSWQAARTGILVTVKLVDPSTLAVVDTQTGTLDVNGNFTIFTTATPGTYTVKIKASHWLTKAVPNVVVGPSGAVSANATLINGDVNGNDSITLADFTAVRVAFNSSVGDANYNAEADLNGSGNVSLADFTILRANFGLSGD